MRQVPLAFAAVLTLASCGDKTADRLDAAANQSDPAAAAVLRNEAAAASGGVSDTNLSAPDGDAQQALANAGEAASATPPMPQPATDAPRHSDDPVLAPPRR